MMKLYHAPPSPFCRKVDVVLHELGMVDQVEIVPASGHPTQTGTMPLTQNPLGKIPALARGDGATLYDSRVICRYVDHVGQGNLYPQPPRLWETLALEATGDGIMDAAVLIVYEGRSRPVDKQDPDWVAGQWAKVTRSLDALEARWMSHLHGPLDIGQIAIGCALGYLDFRHAERGWRDARPTLAAWYTGFAERPSMQATPPA